MSSLSRSSSEMFVPDSGGWVWAGFVQPACLPGALQQNVVAVLWKWKYIVALSQGFVGSLYLQPYSAYGLPNFFSVLQHIL